MTSSNNNFSILANIFRAPKNALKDIQYSYPVAFPLLLSMVSTSVLFLLLFSNINFEWYIEHMVEISAGDKSKAEQDQARQLLEMLSPTMTGVSSAISAAIATLIIYCGFAFYFVFVSSITHDGFQFKQWLSFISWTSLPTLIGVFAGMVVILTSTDGHIALESIDPLSLNQLFFQLDPSHGVGEILASTNILTFWNIALMTIGYSLWTDNHILKSFAIVIIPYVVYYMTLFWLL